jgi:uncharacterized protein with GYD domain
MENVKESPKRANMVREKFRELGGDLKEIYLSLGRYDVICICEAPDEETYAKVVLRAQAAGAIRIESLRVFPESEYVKIIEELS